MYVHKRKCFREQNLIKGHGEMTIENLFSGVVLYPAVFIVCHHLLGFYCFRGCYCSLRNALLYISAFLALYFIQQYS